METIPYSKFHIIHILRAQNLNKIKLIIGWSKIIPKVIFTLINFNYFPAYFKEKFLITKSSKEKENKLFNIYGNLI